MFKNIVLPLFVTIMMLSCANQEAVESVEDQKEYIESYLTTYDYDYTSLGGVYRVVTPSKDPSGIYLESGDSLYFYFAQYLFGSSVGDAYYTNIYSVAAAYGMQTETMDFDAYGIEYGATPLIEGYELGFEGMQQGDTLMLYMTSDMAYGDTQASVVPKNQSIASLVIMEKIVK